MNISELYPSFELTDLWGRKIRVIARQSLYHVEQITLVTQGNRYPEVKDIGRLQFAMLLLMKIEELAGQSTVYNPDDPSQTPPFDAPDLDEWFGPRGEK